jgi:hypothetical protein
MRYILFFSIALILLACGSPSTNTTATTSENNTDGVQQFYLKAEDVPKHIGYDVEVKVTIETTYFKEKENPFPTYLDVKRNYEENPFAIIIPFSVKDRFPPHQTVRGKTVIVRGRVDIYDPWPYDDLAEKKPCIYLRTPDQIQIVN